MRAACVAVLILLLGVAAGWWWWTQQAGAPTGPQRVGAAASEQATTADRRAAPAGEAIRRAPLPTAAEPDADPTSPTSAPDPGLTLHCTVFAAATGQPIGDLAVGLFAKGAESPVDRARTDAAGRVVLHARTAGDYHPLPIDLPEVWGAPIRGRFADPEHPPAAHAPLRHLPSRNGEPVAVELGLSRAATVRGVVMGRDRPVEGATVRVQTEFDLSGVETVTDEAGRFRLPRLPGGRFWLVCVPHSDGFEAPPSREIEVEAGTQLDVGRIDCPPTPTGALRGVVVDRAGAPCANFEILCLDDPTGDDRSGRWVHTDSEGRFGFTGLEPGTKRLVIQERPADLLDHGMPLLERQVDVEDQPIDLGRILVDRR